MSSFNQEEEEIISLLLIDSISKVSSTEVDIQLSSINILDIKDEFEVEVLKSINLPDLEKFCSKVFEQCKTLALKNKGNKSNTKKKIDSLPMSGEIVRYTVVRAKFEHDFIDKVNQSLKNGWVPFGGVSYAAAGMMPGEKSGNSFIQAMVKYVV
jgi:hypothetical protein